MTRVDRVRGPRTATNADEAQAWRWLEGQGQEDIRRSRGDPPDFVVDGRCAVDVRRLNLADPCGKTAEVLIGA